MKIGAPPSIQRVFGHEASWRFTNRGGHRRFQERKRRMLRITIAVAAVLISSSAMAQGLTAAQRDACGGDFEKFCKGTTPGGGRIIACLAKHNDQLTPACQKVLAAAEKK
jgi:hypothetical protein